jgi:hypothetical protein
MIPKTKTWKVTFADGASIKVLAPTRRLAILQTRSECRITGGRADYRDIKSVGVIRK